MVLGGNHEDAALSRGLLSRMVLLLLPCKQKALPLAPYREDLWIKGSDEKEHVAVPKRYDAGTKHPKGHGGAAKRVLLPEVVNERGSGSLVQMSTLIERAGGSLFNLVVRVQSVRSGRYLFADV